MVPNFRICNTESKVDETNSPIDPHPFPHRADCFIYATDDSHDTSMTNLDPSTAELVIMEFKESERDGPLEASITNTNESANDRVRNPSPEHP